MMAAELRAQGFDEETVAAELARDRKSNTIDVLSEHMEIVAVYCNCQWTAVSVGMSGVAETGIAAQEIESALRLLCIPTGRWAEIAQGVRIMANAAGPIRNKRKGKTSADDSFANAAAAHAPARR
jgi:hypothetical protein